jgi:hypothetical protein
MYNGYNVVLKHNKKLLSSHFPIFHTQRNYIFPIKLYNIKRVLPRRAFRVHVKNLKVEIFSILEQGEKQNLFERQPS